MITGDIKQKVDAVWQTFWNNGFTQPSTEYDAPEVIIARMEERQKSIDAAFAEFKNLLNE